MCFAGLILLICLLLKIWITMIRRPLSFLKLKKPLNMKKKTLNAKLSFNKNTISTLTGIQQEQIQGGASVDRPCATITTLPPTFANCPTLRVDCGASQIDPISCNGITRLGC